MPKFDSHYYSIIKQMQTIDIDYTKRLDSSAYCEDIWIEEDSIWVGERRLAAFTITEDYSNDEGKLPSPDDTC